MRLFNPFALPTSPLGLAFLAANLAWSLGRKRRGVKPVPDLLLGVSVLSGAVDSVRYLADVSRRKQPFDLSRFLTSTLNLALVPLALPGAIEGGLGLLRRPLR
ncbi:MAG: hypothetical protein C4524_12630 [Candidatus Zixiibacteriota bacterium]|nr:MAG: hypothetical protein C4524_12630 [candidate division Zixibacteria bacterium]